ncbi:RING-H2 finger protein ATL47-like [Chenopodium quinoa]|uniref:RING-H2 finger protein ATL47-like n=1 Tax=Chenopodium quinoa TaxID=63459 RepID=UPI000B771FA7|nr:RING-H2 finger protein ATL47-like [Chenopodium quinoa]
MSKNSNISIPPAPSTPLPSFPSPPISSNYSTISPVLLLIIVILAIIFFIAGILQFLVRYLMKRPSFYPSNSLSNSRNPESTNSGAIQRQLQQLFRLHDSGLDQPLIDALPVFFYKDIVGSKEPFDCAVCLCEFCDQDKLRLLPLCSHAFHISCIDTWLLSNSTCPLCRGSLLGSELENQEFSLEFWRAMSFGRSIDCETSFRIGNSFNTSHGYKPTIMEENSNERRVFSVRLGKFKSSNDRGGSTREFENGETSSAKGGNGDRDHNNCNGNVSVSSQIDARRCFSLGSYQYVLADSELQVALSTDVGASSRVTKSEKLMGQCGNNHMVDGDIEGKKITKRSKGESFSVSKIWLWSKKGKFQGHSEDSNVNGGPTPFNVVLPLSTRDHVLH